MFILYLGRHRIMEVVLDNPAFGDKNFCLVFSVGYLHSKSVMEVDLDDSASGGINFHFHFRYSVFAFTKCHTSRLGRLGIGWHQFPYSLSVFAICAVVEPWKST